MPTLGKPPKPYHANDLQNEHGAKRSYEPLNWDLFFDELSFLDDVRML